MTTIRGLLRTDRWLLAAAGLVALAIPVAVLDWLVPDTVGWTGIWMELALLILAFAVLLHRGLTAHRGRHRGFWLLLAGAYALWVFANLMVSFYRTEGIPVHVGFVADLCYLCLYVAVLLALELRPDLDGAGRTTRPLLLVEMFGGIVAGFALFVYLVVIPIRVHPASDWVGSYLFYVLLDALVLFALVRNLRNSANQSWRRVYRGMLLSFGVLAVLDSLALSMKLGLLPAVDSVYFGLEPFWMLPHLLLIAAARVKVRDGSADWVVLPKPDRELPQARLRRSSLLAYALGLPMFHLTAYGLNLMEESSRNLREISLLGFLLVFGALALVHLQWVESERAEASGGYRRLFEAVPVMIVVTDGQNGPGRIRDCNPLFAATLAMAERALLGVDLAELLTPFPRPDPAPGWDDAPWEAQLRIGANAGLPVLVHVRRLSGGGRPAWLITLVDLSQQKILEERLRHAQKLESIGRLAGGVAHDFNNILTVVEGYSTLLAERLEDHPELFNHAREIQTAVQRAARLVQQLLAFGRRQILRPTHTRLNQEVSKFSQVLRRILRPEIDLVLGLNAREDEVSIDVGQIQDVLLNLVSNAQDAIRGPGTVYISTREAVRSELEGAELAGPRSHLVLEVADTGAGIPRELHGKIFEPFFTTKGPATAAGLGLSSVLGIVEQSGGRISVSSEPNGGSTFRILLPRVARVAVAAS